MWNKHTLATDHEEKSVSKPNIHKRAALIKIENTFVRSRIRERQRFFFPLFCLQEAKQSHTCVNYEGELWCVRMEDGYDWGLRWCSREKHMSSICVSDARRSIMRSNTREELLCVCIDASTTMLTPYTDRDFKGYLCRRPNALFLELQPRSASSDIHVSIIESKLPMQSTGRMCSRKTLFFRASSRGEKRVHSETLMSSTLTTNTNEHHLVSR